jgi:hypothetical protein
MKTRLRMENAPIEPDESTARMDEPDVGRNVRPSCRLEPYATVSLPVAENEVTCPRRSRRYGDNTQAGSRRARVTRATGFVVSGQRRKVP